MTVRFKEELSAQACIAVSSPSRPHAFLLFSSVELTCRWCLRRK